MSYKKRAKGGWCGGKEYKRDSNRQERIYEKTEIVKELEELYQGDDFRYKHIPKRVRTREDRLESQIRWYSKVLDRWEDKKDDTRSFIGDIVNKYKDIVNKLKLKLVRISSKRKKD